MFFSFFLDSLAKNNLESHLKLW